MFNNCAIAQGADHIVPDDIYLPGRPPRPEMLLDAILKLHDRGGTSPRETAHLKRGGSSSCTARI
jgi:NADH-quinone oxidoreductase subunit B